MERQLAGRQIFASSASRRIAISHPIFPRFSFLFLLLLPSPHFSSFLLIGPQHPFSNYLLWCSRCIAVAPASRLFKRLPPFNAGVHPPASLRIHLHRESSICRLAPRAHDRMERRRDTSCSRGDRRAGKESVQQNREAAK